MRDLPLTVPLEQSEYVGSTGIGARQLARPVLYFEMNNSDTLDDFYACEARIDVRSRTVLVDPLKHMFHRPRILHSLTVAGDGCRRMKGRAHEITITCTCSCDVAVHSPSNRIVLDEVPVNGRRRLSTSSIKRTPEHLVRRRLQASISCLNANTVSCFSCSRRGTGRPPCASQRRTVRSLRSR